MSDAERDPFIESIATELRRPVRLDARFDERVMAAVEAPDVIPLRPSLPRPWIVRPWTISVSPLYALAAALVGLAAIGVWRARGPEVEVATSGAGATPVVEVADAGVARGDVPEMHTFLFQSSAAKSMAITGEFNDWEEKGTAMTRVSEDGMWMVTVPLKPGTYFYQFIVDDSLRVPDPTLPKVADGFGSVNSVITIGSRVR